ncbi:hypothetical protein [Rhizobium sp. BK376]|uniref:hypothetical protein n=1 Tax=Rhizobium sp. BK376 TaxID=2512149 RepID=UPI0010445E93|nr:hypothetical protein [Rhizobium sp. BK376]
MVASFNPPAPAVYIIRKLVLWTRLSDAGANTVDVAVATQSAKLRGIWNSASEVRSESEFFGRLEAFLTGVLGADRANQLPQPE